MKWQLSFKKEIVSSVFSDEKYYFTYTQKVWWQFYEPSAPFRETNYEPEILIVKPYEDGALKQLAFALNHQSNGQDVLKSRSWNRIYLQAFFSYRDKVFYDIKVWKRLEEKKREYENDSNGDDNPDISYYMGYGELHLEIPYSDNTVDSTIRYNPYTKKGSIEFNYLFEVPFMKKMYMIAQYFNGYGESLIDYNRFSNRVSIGVAIAK
jgi:phospholipase A1